MIFYLIFSFVIVLLFYTYYVFQKKHNYWKIRKVPFLKPTLLFGNYIDYIFLRKYAPQVAADICKKFPNEPCIGTFYGTDPALMVQDPEMLKLVMVKDFYYFNGRENTDHAYGEPVTSNLFFNGGDEWKVIRQNLTPVFTSAKIKNMFPLIKNCAADLDNYLQQETKMSQTLKLKSLLARYTMDCIISSVFGINANTMKNANMENPFVIMGEKIFDTSIRRGLKFLSRAMWPSMFYRLGFKVFDDEINVFFNHLFVKGSDNKGVKESSKNYFLDMISEWKNNSFIIGDSISNTKTAEKKTVKVEVTDKLLSAQCIVFFGAGYETTAATMSFLLYELAKNKQIQNRVIEEVEAYLQKNNGAIDYECVHQLPFIEACIEETLRLYPVLGLLTREVMDEYTLPTGLSLHKGDRIHIPVFHIHRNPDHFPEPEVFRPERFYSEERMKIKPFTFFPFGEGPRMCIGLRFAKMPMYAGFITILKKYRIELGENMPLSLEFQPTGVVPLPTTDIQLKFIPRNEDKI